MKERVVLKLFFGVFLSSLLLPVSIFGAFGDILLPDKSLFRERLERHVSFLSGRKFVIGFDCTTAFDKFRSSCVKECGSFLGKNGDLGSLSLYWDRFGGDILSEERSIREFGLVLFSLYSALTSQQYLLSARGPDLLRKPDQSVLSDVVAFCGLLNTVPLERLFEVLDEFLRRYSELVSQQTGGGAQNLSWRDWMGHYWWIPVTSIVFFTAAFLRWRYERLYSRPV